MSNIKITQEIFHSVYLTNQKLPENLLGKIIFIVLFACLAAVLGLFFWMVFYINPLYILFIFAPILLILLILNYIFKTTYTILNDSLIIKTYRATTVINFQDITKIELYQLPTGKKFSKNTKPKDLVRDYFVPWIIKTRRYSRKIFGVILITDNKNQGCLIDPSYMRRENLQTILSIVIKNAVNVDMLTDDYTAIKKIYEENISVGGIDALSTQISKKRYPNQSNIYPEKEYGKVTVLFIIFLTIFCSFYF